MGGGFVVISVSEVRKNPYAVGNWELESKLDAEMGSITESSAFNLTRKQKKFTFGKNQTPLQRQQHSKISKVGGTVMDFIDIAKMEPSEAESGRKSGGNASKSGSHRGSRSRSRKSLGGSPKSASGAKSGDLRESGDGGRAEAGSAAREDLPSSEERLISPTKTQIS